MSSLTLPTIALVGRPNVGKSTLFNRLTRSRRALVANFPGLTRDRQYGDADLGERRVTLIDTGGLSGEADGIDPVMAGQALTAVEEADLVAFMVDAREGLTATDAEVADRLRRTGRPLVLVVNKVDGVDELALNEFHALGCGEPIAVSASHGRGMAGLREAFEKLLPPVADAYDPDAQGLEPDGQDDADDEVVVGIIGRPNVGKSTLVNRMLGDERVVVFDQPGTTRDAIEVPLERDGERYVLIDTAGVRRRGRVSETIEKFSIIKTLDAIRAARVVLLVIDAREGIVDQDLHLLGYALDAGRSVLVVANKWDGLSQDARSDVRNELQRRLVFAPWIETRFVSALHGSGVGGLLVDARRVYESGRLTAGSSELTKVLEDAVADHPPPMVRGRRIKLRFAHPGGSHPPTIVIHGNQTEALPSAYRRFLENRYRDWLGLVGTPVRIELKSSTNPFAGRRNKLTERQQRRRKRLIRHVKKR